MEALGPKLRRQRRRLGLTLDELAGRTSISKPYLSLIETGRVPNPPSDEKLRRLEQTLGFTPGAILSMILGEALAISLLGGTIGFLISTVLASGVSRSAGGFLPPIPPFQPAVAAACILTAAVIGLVSSLVPAAGAARTPIVDALRSTD